MRIRMNVSIASAQFSHQPGDVVDVDDELAAKWVSGGHAERVSPRTPLSNRNNFDLRDLDADEALSRTCVHCNRRARFVLRNKAFCPQHFRSELEG